MEDRKFFETIENKLGITVPQRIKSHLKFHTMDSFQVAAKLNEVAILDIEDFARSTLHQILKPDEMVQFYGPHFQDKPTLFVFTLGERMHLTEITQLCKDICDGKEEALVDCEVESDLNELTEKLAISSGQSGKPKQNENEKKVNRTRRREKKVELFSSLQNENEKKVNRTRKTGKTEATVVRLANLEATTTVKELRDIVKKFGTIKRVFLARNEETGLCNGFGSVEFFLAVDAAAAIEGLNGLKYKNNVLKARSFRP